MDSKELARLVFRPALHKDTDGMLELTSQIWEGNDYLPKVWSDWLADPDGFLAVAELAGRVVGIGMLQCFKPGECYLAGLRVHPEMEGQGIASRLQEYQLQYWRRVHGWGVLRLATHNTKVIHLCERTGFTSIGEFTIFVANRLPGVVESFSPLGHDQVDRALDIACNSQVFEWHARLYGHGWWWSDPQPKYVMDAINKGCAWLWRGGMGVLVTGEDDGDDGPISIIELAGCPSNHLVEMLLDYRKLITSQGYQQAGWVASLHPELQPYLAEAGFLRDWDQALTVFELRSGDMV